MSERWVVLDKYGEIDGGTFDDSDDAALHMLDCENDVPFDAPYTVTRIYTQAELDAAVVAEREACAKLCDELDNGENSGDYANAARWCATRIHARGDA